MSVKLERLSPSWSTCPSWDVRSAIYLPISNDVLIAMNWKEGDDIAVEPVVNKEGHTTHIVLEKKD